MKKSWQRLGSAFLAFLMVFTMLPASVLADSGTAADTSPKGSEIPAASGTPAVRSVINPGTDSSSYQTYRFYVEGALVDTQVVKTGDSIAADVTFPVNADQAVTGWYTEAGLTNRVESVTLGEANITLYPKVENGHWITYDSKGGSYVEPAFVAPSDVTAAPAVPSGIYLRRMDPQWKCLHLWRRSEREHSARGLVEGE